MTQIDPYETLWLCPRAADGEHRWVLQYKSPGGVWKALEGTLVTMSFNSVMYELRAACACGRTDDARVLNVVALPVPEAEDSGAIVSAVR